MATPQEVLQLLEQLDECIQNWPKGGGMLLDLVAEKLKVVQKTFVEDITAALPPELLQQITDEATPPALANQDEPDIFVALYQVDGGNLDKWAYALSTIAFQGVFRPIYSKEEDICKMIQTKENRSNEGYAVITIQASAIVYTAKENLDKLGNTLVHIKPGSLQSKNIKRFVHVSGQYLWQNNALTKLDLPSPLIGI